MKFKFCVCFVLAILMASAVQLQADNVSSKAESPTLEDFNWLVGHWRGKGLGGDCEETWLPESGGCMLGTFKFVKGDNVSFFEMMSITIDSVGPALRIKHFNADMTGWEDKAEMVTFRYDSTSSNQVFFGGVKFLRPSKDSLLISVSFKNKDGGSKEELIRCRRVEIK